VNKKISKKKVESEAVPVVIKKDDDYAIIEPIEKEIKPQEVPKKKPKYQKAKIFEKKKETKTEHQEKSEKVGKAEEERRRAYKKIKESMKKFPVDMIETDIDKLMSMIEKEKSVSVLDVSKELKVSVEQIENWAKILEEHGLIEIIYPLIGFPRLRKKEWKKES
jgi:hypothetical protein